MTVENMKQIELITPDFDGAAKILWEYKGRYAGRRCFIIGNGPSLKAADLTRIKENGDFSIASNRIYLIFDQTDWRPDVFTSADEECIAMSLAEMSAIEAELKIIPVMPSEKMFPVKGALPVHFHINDNNWIIEGTSPSFSDDITQWIGNGKTITYVNMQIAAYLGFKEWILIGVDHCYSKYMYVPDYLRNYDWKRNRLNLQPGQSIEIQAKNNALGEVQNHFCTDYADGLSNGEGEAGLSYWIEESVRAYKSAQQYATSHGIRIVNATRGGKLNVFKRVSFDSLFPKPSG